MVASKGGTGDDSGFPGRPYGPGPGRRRWCGCRPAPGKAASSPLPLISWSRPATSCCLRPGMPWCGSLATTSDLRFWGRIGVDPPTQKAIRRLYPSGTAESLQNYGPGTIWVATIATLQQLYTSYPDDYRALAAGCGSWWWMRGTTNRHRPGPRPCAAWADPRYCSPPPRTAMT